MTEPLDPASPKAAELTVALAELIADVRDRLRDQDTTKEAS